MRKVLPRTVVNKKHLRLVLKWLEKDNIPTRCRDIGCWHVLVNACCDQAGLNLHGRCSTLWQSTHRIEWLSSLQDSASRPEWFCKSVLRRIGEWSASLRQPKICDGS